MTHRMETYERSDGKRGWRFLVDDDVTATDGGQGYENEKDCLAGLFGNFFDEWDDSFLELYQKWQSYKGVEPPAQTPETQEGVPVAEQVQPPTPEEDAAADDAILEGRSASEEGGE
jgi:hypothetical protein